MFDALRDGYSEAGGQRPAIWLGQMLGVALRTALQTVIVVSVLRLMGVI
ncbi:MAG TPA: hypothetical protein VGN60_07565 [Devosia sp.]|jgi:hypothetical protein|nr:hypothetical protein [Devosia sp.]